MQPALTGRHRSKHRLAVRTCKRQSDRVTNKGQTSACLDKGRLFGITVPHTRHTDVGPLQPVAAKNQTSPSTPHSSQAQYKAGVCSVQRMHAHI
jgi:hypothetical protein